MCVLVYNLLLFGGKKETWLFLHCNDEKLKITKNHENVMFFGEKTSSTTQPSSRQSTKMRKVEDKIRKKIFMLKIA